MSSRSNFQAHRKRTRQHSKTRLDSLGLDRASSQQYLPELPAGLHDALRALRKVNLWTLSTLSVAELKTRLAQMPDRTSSREPYNSYGCTCGRTRREGRHLAAQVEGVYKTVNGVCLDCVRRKEAGMNHSTCRVHCVGTHLTYG